MNEFKPYEYQKKFLESNARIRVVSAGIGTGKDLTGIYSMIKQANDCLKDGIHNEKNAVRIAFFAPSEPLLKELFNMFTKIYDKKYSVERRYVEEKLISIAVDGGNIHFDFITLGSNLICCAFDGVYISEVARFNFLDDLFHNCYMRTLSPNKGINGKGGKIVISSSPLKDDFFFNLWQFGNKNSTCYDIEYESFNWNYWDNPKMEKKRYEIQKNGLTYEQNLIQRMPIKNYVQDYLGKFII